MFCLITGIMSGCCIVNCTSTNNGGDISYFRFPKDESIRQQWIKASRIEKDINTGKYSHIKGIYAMFKSSNILKLSLCCMAQAIT